MTRAQREALEVLASEDGQLVKGWKQRSQKRQRGKQGCLPRVNYLAAGNLVKQGLAICVWSRDFNPFGHSDEYRITDAGLAALK